MTILRETNYNPFTKKGTIFEERKKEIKPYNRDGAPSPIFPFSNSAILTTSEELFDIHSDDTRTKKYGAFTNFRITNTSAYNILLYVNQNRNNGTFIANNTSVELKRGDLGGGYTSFILYNLGAGTIAESEVRIEVFKEGATIDNSMKEANLLIHKAMRMIRGF